MDLDRLSTGEKIAGGSAILLFIFMFFDWFSVDVSGTGGLVAVSEGGNAWDWLDVIPFILLIAIVAAVGVAVVRFTDADFEPEISMNAVVSVLGGISALLILYRIIDTPGQSVSGGGVSVDVNPALGIFLGLIAAVGIAYGGYRAMQEEGTSFGEVGERLGGGRGSRGGGPGAGGPGAGQTPPPPPPPSATPPPPPPPPSSEQGGPPPQ
jgi:uncharacterized membrane protein YhaH (DUF805 family)